MGTVRVKLARLQAPATRLTADDDKLLRHGPFSWEKYTPIIVEQDGTALVVQDGMTRVENARRAGIDELPAYIFPKR